MNPSQICSTPCLNVRTLTSLFFLPLLFFILLSGSFNILKTSFFASATFVNFPINENSTDLIFHEILVLNDINFTLILDTYFIVNSFSNKMIIYSCQLRVIIYKIFILILQCNYFIGKGFLFFRIFSARLFCTGPLSWVNVKFLALSSSS